MCDDDILIFSDGDWIYWRNYDGFDEPLPVPEFPEAIIIRVSDASYEYIRRALDHEYFLNEAWYF